MTERLTQARYDSLFDESAEKRKAALASALDNRKFEIDLYWRRATYFWTLIGASLVAYGAAQALKAPAVGRDLSVFVSCLGFVFSFAWYCANRGSKQWQENWENHVDLLEDEITGPLYKVVLRRTQARGILDHLSPVLTGPGPYSVSKINQLVSVYVSLLWIGLAIRSLGPFSREAAWRTDYVLLVVLTLGTALAIWWLGQTHDGAIAHVADLRHSEIRKPADVQVPPISETLPGPN
jgi:hypothetical protein